jgi:hypothetical protein
LTALGKLLKLLKQLDSVWIYYRVPRQHKQSMILGHHGLQGPRGGISPSANMHGLQGARSSLKASLLVLTAIGKSLKQLDSVGIYYRLPRQHQTIYAMYRTKLRKDVLQFIVVS